MESGLINGVHLQTESKMLKMNKTFISFGVYNTPPTAKLITESDEWFGIFVEPHTHGVLTLQKYFEENGIPEERYLILRNIVSNDNSAVKYGFTSPDRGTGRNGIIAPQIHYEYSVSMMPITLDQLTELSRYPIEHIRMNCEGAELQILENYSFNCKPKTFFVETHDDLYEEGTVQRIKEIMHKNGYETSIEHRWQLGYLLNFSRRE